MAPKLENNSANAGRTYHPQQKLPSTKHHTHKLDDLKKLSIGEIAFLPPAGGGPHNTRTPLGRSPTQKGSYHALSTRYIYSHLESGNKYGPFSGTAYKKHLNPTSRNPRTPCGGSETSHALRVVHQYFPINNRQSTSRTPTMAPKIMISNLSNMASSTNKNVSFIWLRFKKVNSNSIKDSSIEFEFVFWVGGSQITNTSELGCTIQLQWWIKKYDRVDKHRTQPNSHGGGARQHQPHGETDVEYPLHYQNGHHPQQVARNDKQSAVEGPGPDNYNVMAHQTNTQKKTRLLHESFVIIPPIWPTYNHMKKWNKRNPIQKRVSSDIIFAQLQNVGTLKHSTLSKDKRNGQIYLFWYW